MSFLSYKWLIVHKVRGQIFIKVINGIISLNFCVDLLQSPKTVVLLKKRNTKNTILKQ